MHYGLEWAGVQATVIASFDCNPTANECYEFNFGLKPYAKNIQQLTMRELEDFCADIWMMSPPCQPFTRSNTIPWIWSIA